MTDLLSEALDYARRGWYVFPCREKPGDPYVKNGETLQSLEKTPYVSKGLYDATLDEDQIKAWWKMWPNAMIGINAGQSGLFVVDIDRKHVNGLDTFSSWNINDGAGLHSMTPSGGMHIVFTGNGKSSTNAKTGIDTRGEGGYFIAPPSKILEGENIGEYRRFDDWTRTPGIIPDGLMSNLFPENTTQYVRGNSAFDGNGKKQLSRATLNFLANGAPAGERNSTLFKVLADFNGCGYSIVETRDAVLPVSRRIDFPDAEFEKVLDHAFSRPRTAAIPDAIQEKIMAGDKKIASKITFEEQGIIENALLACMISRNDIIPAIEDILNFEDFRVLKNRVIYRVITRLYDSETKVDFVTISDEILKETDRIPLDDILKISSEFFVNPDHATAYANIIKEKSSIAQVEALMDNKSKYLASGNLVEIISHLESDISSIALEGGVKSTNILNSEQAVEMVADRTRRIMSGEIEQVKIGFYDYDQYIGGVYPTELIICAGRSGEGKSALALSILRHVSLYDSKAAALFSLEMSTHETICRLICQETGLPFRNVYQGKLTEPQWKEYKLAMEKISDSKLYFDDSPGITVPGIRSKIRKLLDKDIKMVVIDQLEQISGYEGLPPHIKYDNITYDIKRCAKEFNIPIILNHQLNRGVLDRKLKNPEPQIGDLNQAGEKAANQVWIIAHQKDEHGDILQSKVKVLKNRNGPRIDFPVVFIGEKMLFANLSRDDSYYTNGGINAKTTNDDDDDPTPYWAKYD